MARHVPVFAGLLTGFVETKFLNPRMGLAAHLEGVMNGTFLVALGAVWDGSEAAVEIQKPRPTGARFTELT